MALTATANHQVRDDIVRSLKIQGCITITSSFNRTNLHYEIRPKPKKVTADIADFMLTDHRGQCGIIYASSRDQCEKLAKELRDTYEVEAAHYHAGMTKDDRAWTQSAWQVGEVQVIVATIAFGMGIDKADGQSYLLLVCTCARAPKVTLLLLPLGFSVRFVIHHALPRSLEGYYQETGRAGRDGLPSTCVLYYSWGDTKSIFSNILRDKNLTREQAERQRENVRGVLRYCTNKTDCRRRQVLVSPSD